MDAPDDSFSANMYKTGFFLPKVPYLMNYNILTYGGRHPRKKKKKELDRLERVRER